MKDKSNYEKVLAETIKLFNSDEKAAVKWLETPSVALANVRPVDMLSSDKEIEVLFNFIGQLENGVFP
jgi:putative toxin-antitoxin system antitoxin component (TIGR02293 family)